MLEIIDVEVLVDQGPGRRILGLSVKNLDDGGLWEGTVVQTVTDGVTRLFLRKRRVPTWLTEEALLTAA